MNDLQGFFRAVRALAKLGGKHGLETHLDALGKHATAKQKEDVMNASAMLDPIAKALLQHRVNHVERRCRQCGQNLDTSVLPNAMLGIEAPGMQVFLSERRPDAQYCGPTCRQSAYRARVVTAKTAKHERKRHVVTDEDGEATASRNDDG